MLTAKSGLRLWSAAHPLWMCGMRPFFVATAWGACALMLPWLAHLALGLPAPSAGVGPLAWHAHELLLGVALASVAGFLLTSIPEFTATPEFAPRTLRQLVALWGVARLSFWLSGAGGWPLQALAALSNLGFVLALGAQVVPRLWQDRQRAHLAFGWALALLALCVAGFHAEVLLGAPTPTRWLHAAVHVFMALVVLAQSRISMRVVNQALDDAGVQTHAYLARPPRRNLVLLCLAGYAAAELAWPGSRLSGWLALAAAAAVFNLLNDWHVGRALLRRRPLMLYGGYACMGAGYALIGAGLLAKPELAAGGRHLLTVGALGLPMLAAMTIAGRAHCGQPAHERPWIVAAALALVAAAITRAAAAAAPAAAPLLWSLSALGWCAAFGLWAWHMTPLLLTRRTDGRSGCAGVD